MADVFRNLFGKNKTKEEVKEKLIYCMLCSNVVNSPVHLPCKDVFCRDCIQVYMKYKKMSELSLICPTCGQNSNSEVPMPNSIFPDIPKDNPFLKLLETVTLEKDLIRCEEVHCQSRELQNLSIGRCFDCKSSLCATCCIQHELKNHYFIKSSGKLSTSCKANPSHSTLNSYCEKCNIPFCNLCDRKHQGHTVSEASLAAQNLRSILAKVQIDLKESEQRLDRLQKQLEAVYEIKRRDLRDISNGIRSFVAQVIQQIQNNEKTLLDQCEKLMKYATVAKESQTNYTSYMKRCVRGLQKLVVDFDQPGREIPLFLQWESVDKRSRTLWRSDVTAINSEFTAVLKKYSFDNRFDFKELGKMVHCQQPYVLPNCEHFDKPSEDENSRRFFEIIPGESLLKWQKLCLNVQGDNSKPHGICFGSSGRRDIHDMVIVAENGARRISCYDMKGSKVDEISFERFSPKSIVQMFSDRPQLAVADQFEMKVKLIGYSSARTDRVQIVNQKYSSPSGLAILLDCQDFIVSDIEDYSLSRITPDGKIVWKLGSKNDKKLISPEFVTVDHFKRIIVSEKSCVKIFDSDGKQLSELMEHRSESCQQSWSPGGLCVDNRNNIYVADSCNHRVMMYSRDGTFIRDVLTAPAVKWVYGLAWSNDGHLCLTEKDGKIKVFKLTCQ